MIEASVADLGSLYDWRSLVCSRLPTVVLAIISLSLLPSCQSMTDYRAENRLAEEVLGMNIDHFKRDMTEAKTLRSEEAGSASLDSVFAWEYLPEVEGADMKNVYDKIKVTVFTNRNGEIIEVLKSLHTANRESLKDIYRGRILSLIEKYGNSECQGSGFSEIEPFRISSRRMRNWGYLKKCELITWENLKGGDYRGGEYRLSASLTHRFDTEGEGRIRKLENQIDVSATVERYRGY